MVGVVRATNDPTTRPVANTAYCIVVHARRTCRCVRPRTSQDDGTLSRQSAVPVPAATSLQISGTAQRTHDDHRASCWTPAGVPRSVCVNALHLQHWTHVPLPAVVRPA